MKRPGELGQAGEKGEIRQIDFRHTQWRYVQPWRGRESGKRAGTDDGGVSDADVAKEGLGFGERPAPHRGQGGRAVGAGRAENQADRLMGHGEPVGAGFERCTVPGAAGPAGQNGAAAPDLSFGEDDDKTSVCSGHDATEAAKLADEVRRVRGDHTDRSQRASTREADLRIAQIEPELRPAVGLTAHACPDLCRVFVRGA